MNEDLEDIINEYNEIFQLEDEIALESIRNELPAWNQISVNLEHIMKNHSEKGRILNLLANIQMRIKIKNKFSLTDSEYGKVKNDMEKKINNGYTLNNQEKQIFDFILKNNRKDLFPYNMSEAQIHKMIRTAYSNAKKIKWKQFSKKGDEDIWVSANKYQGESGGMTIHFWFDFENNSLDTVYPILNSLAEKITFDEAEEIIKNDRR